MNNTASNSVTMKMVQDIVGDLSEPKQSIYFADLFASAVVGWAMFIVAISSSSLGLAIVSLLVGSFFLFRGLAFIHELVHQHRMKLFRYFWHALIGVPLLVPLLLYLPTHMGHHSKDTYGTKKDGEYDQLRGRFWPVSIKLFFLGFALPIALIVRFGLLTPLSALLPIVRTKVIPEFVHMSLRFPFTAEEPRQSWKKEFYFVEFLCMLVAWLLLSGLWTGNWKPVAAWYATLVMIGSLNMARALWTTHLYVEQEVGRSAGDQLTDSMNVTGGGLITLLMCPTGLRYHALHHVAAYLPYHALGQAHQRLIQRLPPGSSYHSAGVANLFVGYQRVLTMTAKSTPRHFESEPMR